MARLLRELVHKPSLVSSRLIATFTHQNTTNVFPPLFANQSILNNGDVLNPSNKGFRAREEELEVGHLSKLQIYPSFSFGFLLNQILPSGSGLSELVRPVGATMEHSGMMWADSVKKKRKKKMNKHKYKKLRKRLRRKTKT